MNIEYILKETNTLLDGHFLLTSGRHSNQYMQCAKILQYPNYAAQIASVLAEFYANDNVDIVAGPAMGGIIIAYELARQLNVKNIFAERVDGKMTIKRGFEIPSGSRVIVAEDVVTTGGSVREVIDVIRDMGGIVVGVASLVDRSNGTVDFGVKFKAAYVANVVSFDEDECPLCKSGDIKLVKPGSR